MKLSVQVNEDGSVVRLQVGADTLDLDLKSAKVLAATLLQACFQAEAIASPIIVPRGPLPRTNAGN